MRIVDIARNRSIPALAIEGEELLKLGPKKFLKGWFVQGQRAAKYRNESSVIARGGDVGLSEGFQV